MVSIAEMEGLAREGDEGDCADHAGMGGLAREGDEGDYTDHVGKEGWNGDEDERDYVYQAVNKAIKLPPSEVTAGQG